MSKRIARHPAEKGEDAQAIGRSHGGRTSKLHKLADDRGRPAAIGLPPGNIAGITLAKPLLEAVAPLRRLIADKAYDANLFPVWLQQRDSANHRLGLCAGPQSGLSDISRRNPEPPPECGREVACVAVADEVSGLRHRPPLLLQPLPRPIQPQIAQKLKDRLADDCRELRL